jgi:outer membrane protein assembly factor BamB
VNRLPVLCAGWLCLALAALAGPAAAENWPQWRGPNNDGISHEKGLPAQWSADKDLASNKNIAWKLEMPGPGGSTPIVWGERIFLTSQDDKKIIALCVSTAGKQLWKRELGPATPKYRYDEGNGASASPSTDGKHVYFFTGNGDMAAFDLGGKESWRFNAQQRWGKFKIWHGMHTTPLLYKDRLYLQLIHGGGAWVICLDRASGKEVWKAERKSDATDENEHSYASVVLWTNGKDAYLVCHGGDYATAHRLEDGKEIWRLGDLNPKDRYNRFLRFVASPACSPELIVVPTAKNGPVVGVKPQARGRINAGSKYEQWRLERGTPDVPSPLIHDGLVYLCGEFGGLTCIEAKTGKQVYRRATHRHRHRASPVLGDGKLYLTARDGTVTVVEAGKAGKVLATNKLPDQAAASPVVSGGRIYLRGFKNLWAIEEKK